MNKVYAVNEISSIVATILGDFGAERVWIFGCLYELLADRRTDRAFI